MSRLVVDTSAARLSDGLIDLPCAIGRGGACPTEEKCEGDGRTPLGNWPIRALLLRPDRVRLATSPSLPWRWIAPHDGWSDDPRDPAYNRAVSHPHSFSAERLWRTDELYDLIIILGHNDAPPVPGRGSAIFLHCWRDRAPTEGCIAIERSALLALAPILQPGDTLTIR